MKTGRNILIAFILNLSFSIFELFGGFFTGSVAIMSDAVHDVGDAMSIGVAYFLENKSGRQPDEKYTYGYTRYSVLGSVITTVILIISSVLVIVNAISKMINPSDINYNGMIIFAVVGVAVNLCAAYFTHEGDSLNQKAVNLHMIEDVLGWVVVLIGAIVIKFTGFVLIDPIMSICVALFILYNAILNLKSVLDIFLLKTPDGIAVQKVQEYIGGIDGIKDVHHIHVWSIDNGNIYATLHVVTDEESHMIKDKIRHTLFDIGIVHSTIEIEKLGEHCHEQQCTVAVHHKNTGCHHHHH